MIFRSLRTGTKAQALAFGSGAALYGRGASAQAFQALEAGFRHLDVAQHYGNKKSVQEGLVRYLSNTSQGHSSVFVTRRTGQTVKDVLKDGLAHPKPSYVDLYLIHTPEGLDGKLGPLWKQFEELKMEGSTKDRIFEWEICRNSLGV